MLTVINSCLLWIWYLPLALLCILLSQSAISQPYTRLDILLPTNLHWTLASMLSSYVLETFQWNNLAGRNVCVFNANPRYADVECRRYVIFFYLFFFPKNLRIWKFHCHIWNHLEKCIQMSTNKPSIGSGFLRFPLVFWENLFFFSFGWLKL